MAQSKSFFDDVKKELECPVCQEQFSQLHEPKIMKCLHTFCKTCLEAWLRQHREGQLSCPTCRQITECPNSNINSLPSNLFYKQMVEIVEAYSGQGKKDSPHCGLCDEKKALKFYCFERNSFLCDDCIGVHKKGKIFSGHHVKDIGNFQSCDVQDYARRTNYCTVHIDEMRFYCENCKRCICRDCAILEHQDHNKISLDQGLENIKSEIDIKVHEAQKNGSRMRSYKVSLEKRRMKVDGSIEEATKEVKRIAELCILSIRQHEASVTEQLIKRKQAFKNAFDNQMTMLDGKLKEIDSTLAFSEEILLRNNLPEILNVKAVLEEKLREVSVPFQPLEALPKLGYSEVKYMQNDVFLKDAPGKLVTSDTEPLLSVAEGKNLTEGLVGADGTFTVTTKNAQGQTSYCAIDEVIANISSLSGHETLQTVVTDLKDGRYLVSYNPKTPGTFTVSVEVLGNPIMGSPFTLEVKNQPDISEQGFELEPKIHEVIVKAHKKELEDIEIKYHVEIPRKADGNEVSLKPKDSCTTEDYEQACDQFVSLYQNTLQQLKMQRFSLKTETNVIRVRQTISKMSKQFPVSVQLVAKSNQKRLWELYGEENNIEEALRFLEEEGVEINREREDEKGGHKKVKDVEDRMEVATPEPSRREVCPICIHQISKPRSLNCKHSFCSECIQAALKACNKCPVCQQPQGIIQGNQPHGQMTFRVDRYSVPGYEGYGTIVIDYHLPSGLQGSEHPNPGQFYQGTSRTAYLPDNREGREVLQLLRRAFDARLVFTVGKSNTTGLSNQVIWNDIHHKTNRFGGASGFGYPDPDYFRRVKEELAAKGIQ